MEKIKRASSRHRLVQNDEMLKMNLAPASYHEKLVWVQYIIKLTERIDLPKFLSSRLTDYPPTPDYSFIFWPKGCLQESTITCGVASKRQVWSTFFLFEIFDHVAKGKFAPYSNCSNLPFENIFVT